MSTRVRLSLATIVCALGIACAGSTTQAKALLAAGDWGGARNVLDEGLTGGGGSVEDRGLLLFALAAPEAARGGSESWFLKACALEPSAASYLLAPSADEQEKVDRLRNDARRSLKDKGVDTASVDEFGAVLRAAVTYGLTEQPWKPEHALAQGSVGLCGLWLGMEGADRALMASLGSQGALVKGADRYFAVAGERILAPLRAAAANQDDVASGPAADILRDLLHPIAQQAVIGSVEKPVAPRAWVRERALAENLAAPAVSTRGPNGAAATASTRVRGWFNLTTDAERSRIAGWAGQILEVKGRPVEFAWTWDELAGAGRLYALTWMQNDWTRVTFDGRDPLGDVGQIVLSVGPASADGGDFVVELLTGVGERVETTQTWAGPVSRKVRGFQVERRAYRLDGASATFLAPVADAGSP